MGDGDASERGGDVDAKGVLELQGYNVMMNEKT